MNDYEIDAAIESIINDMDHYDYDDYAMESGSDDPWKTYGALATGAMVGQAAVQLGNHSWNLGLVNGLRKRTNDAIASGDRRIMKETRKYMVSVREDTLRNMRNTSQTMVIRACEENIALLDGALRAR